jgi:hypothetical protein
MLARAWMALSAMLALGFIIPAAEVVAVLTTTGDLVAFRDAIVHLGLFYDRFSGDSPAT